MIISNYEKKTVIISALILICTIIFAVDSAHAQQYTGILRLDPIPAAAKPGSTITLSGQLTTTSGHVVPGAKIYIKDDVTFDIDTILKTVTTDRNGKFHTTWTATVRSSGAWDIYAVFEGNSDVERDRSTTYSIRVSSLYTGANTGSSDNYAGGPRSTTITLDRIPSLAYAGDTVTFTGKLVSGGRPLPNAMVQIYEDDRFLPDQRIGYQRTDSNGRFAITWNVGAGLIEKDFDIYAVFDGDSLYKRDRSPNQIMTVLKYDGNITLEPIPRTAKVGERITFSGTLRLEKFNPEGMIVYIKDEDRGTGDDLLGTGYVNQNGRFSVDWIADYTDSDDVVDVYAVFEGNDLLYRQTTCDRGPTLDIGGICRNTIPLKIHGYIQTSPPPNYLAGEEYIELYYSIPFNRAPHVAIVPNPDSYSEVRGHITPVKEGILMWEAYMEQRYGGIWDVTFEVVEPGKLRYESRPDVIVNLDTYEDHSGCKDYYGFAYIRIPINLPVQTHVCSTHDGERRSNVDVGATAAHEFIHAVGLGHTFNKYGDFMCSEENGIPTCNGLRDKSKTPSSLNLAAVARIYGTDGFIGPNNYVEFGEKFQYDSNDNNAGMDFTYRPSPSPVPPVTTPVNGCDYDNVVYDQEISDSLKSGWYSSYTICNNGYISYYFTTNNEYQGFLIYLLPPETDIGKFLEHRKGEYYLCEEIDEIWVSKGNRCNVAVGSNIVLYNPNSYTIEFTGYIKN